MPSVLNPLLNTLGQLWDSRAPRERWAISLGAGVLLLGIVYAGVLEPAFTGISRLKTSLPIAQAKLAQVQSLALQVSTQNQIQPKNDTIATQTSLQTNLTTAGLQGTVSATTPWTITLTSANGETLWQWLRQHPASHTELKRNASGNWSGTITLTP